MRRHTLDALGDRLGLVHGLERAHLATEVHDTGADLDFDVTQRFAARAD